MPSERRYPYQPPVRYKMLIATLRFLVKTLTRYRITGQEHVPDEGPIIYVANHLHYFDTPVLGISVPRPARPLAGERYQKHIFSVILKTGGAIFINRGEVDRKALRQALNVLEDGLPLAVAVEGTRSKSGALSEGKTGAAYFATRANVKMVPVALWGTENVVPSWKKLRRAEVNVVIGEPFMLPEGRASSAQLNEYTDRIMLTLAGMLPEKYRGVYADHPELPQYIVRTDLLTEAAT